VTIAAWGPLNPAMMLTVTVSAVTPGADAALPAGAASPPADDGVPLDAVLTPVAARAAVLPPPPADGAPPGAVGPAAASSMTVSLVALPGAPGPAVALVAPLRGVDTEHAASSDSSAAATAAREGAPMGRIGPRTGAEG
jgi:hypothetical protein